MQIDGKDESSQHPAPVSPSTERPSIDTIDKIWVRYIRFSRSVRFFARTLRRRPSTPKSSLLKIISTNLPAGQIFSNVVVGGAKPPSGISVTRALPPCLAPNFYHPKIFSVENVFDRKVFRPKKFSVENFFGQKKLGARHGGKARPLRRQGTGNERRFLGGQAPQTPRGARHR